MLHGNIAKEKTTVLDYISSRCQTAFFRLSCGFRQHKQIEKRGVATQD